MHLLKDLFLVSLETCLQGMIVWQIRHIHRKEEGGEETNRWNNLSINTSESSWCRVPYIIFLIFFYIWLIYTNLYIYIIVIDIYIGKKVRVVSVCIHVCVPLLLKTFFFFPPSFSYSDIHKDWSLVLVCPVLSSLCCVLLQKLRCHKMERVLGIAHLSTSSSPLGS